MKALEKSPWHLLGNCKRDLQAALTQDCDVGHCHLQLILSLEEGWGAGGHGSDVPSPCNLAARWAVSPEQEAGAVPSSA